jgi:7-carboxy-7-deazaguanine synthase
MDLDVHSIFYTIQGEGLFCGVPAVFVRLAGCNLQCPSCDTDYTTERGTSNIGFIVGMINRLSPFDRPLVVITGGEPFRQNITPLCNALIDEQRCVVQVETNGTLPPPEGLHKDVQIVCSPKAGKVNGLTAARATCFKYVLSHDSVDPEDGLPVLALNHSASPRVARPPDGYIGTVYLQPMDAGDEGINKLNQDAVVQSCMTYGYVLQLQIHKIIGVE